MHQNLEVEKIKKLFTWPIEKPNVKENRQHWFQTAGICGLYSLIDGIRPKIILELGSWTGAGSTTFILKNSPESHLICVDHWSSDKETHAKQFTDGNMTQINMDAHLYPFLWDTFLANTWDYQSRLTPIRKKTEDALPYLHELNIPIDLIYIDAHHNYEAAFHDISKCLEYWPNALICGDDYDWKLIGDDGVEKAVTECAKKYKLTINVIGNLFWYFTK